MKQVKFWSRVSHEKYDEWVLVAGTDPNHLPLRCWKTYNKVFWQWLSQGRAWPEDPLEAYQRGAQLMTAAWLKGASAALTKAKRTTYTIAAGVMGLKNYVHYNVEPTRTRYRQLADTCRVKEDDESETTKLDVRAYVESLGGLSAYNARESRTMARTCIKETLPKCRAETRRALKTLLACDLDMKAAAAAFGLPRRTFCYRCEHVWFAEFREKCTWAW